MTCRLPLLIVLVCGLSAHALSGTALAQGGSEAGEPIFEPPPVYEESLLRLSEILGGLYFLRGLCGSGDADVWKADMQAILAAEEPGPQRRARLIARFNHGFETYNAIHKTCTPASRRAMTLFLDEARRTVIDVRLRYSQ